MSDIKKQIKDKIKERIAFAEKCADAACEKNLHSTLEANEMLIRQYKSLLTDIDSLPEEKPSEDLNKLIQKWDRIDINTVLKVKVKATGKVIDGFYDGRGHFDHFVDHDVFDRYSIDEVELMPDEEPSEDLEEAANEYAILDEEGKWKDGGKYKGFIAGAEWMRKKDVEDMYMSDNRHFLKCYEQGKVDMKVEMMKDAVEGTVICYCDGTYCVESCCFDNNGHYKSGDKVKILIVKEKIC